MTQEDDCLRVQCGGRGLACAGGTRGEEKRDTNIVVRREVMTVTLKDLCSINQEKVVQK